MSQGLCGRTWHISLIRQEMLPTRQIKHFTSSRPSLVPPCQYLRVSLCATADIKLCDILWFDPVALMSLNEDTDTKSWPQRILTDKDRMISCLNSYKCQKNNNYITTIWHQIKFMQLHRKNSNFTDYYPSFNGQNKLFFTTANVKTVILNCAKSFQMTKCDICTELKNNKNCTAA